MHAYLWEAAIRELAGRRTLYAYLPEERFIETWELGGRMPIKLASAWLAAERLREKTLDERTVFHASAPLEALDGFIKFSDGAELRDILIENVSGVPDMWIKERRYEDVFALCFAHHLSGYIAAKFERRFCVAVDDLGALKDALDVELGVKGEGGRCAYTLDHRRDRRLKSIADSWQSEYRLTWPLTEALKARMDSQGQVWVDLRPGYGRRVKVPACPYFGLDDERALRANLQDAIEHLL